MWALHDGLLDRVGQQHVLVRVFLEHLFEQQGPPLLLQLSPVLLAGFVKLIFVRHVPDRFNFQRIHQLSARFVDATVVQEKMDLLVITQRGSDLLQEGRKLLFIEGVVFYLIS